MQRNEPRSLSIHSCGFKLIAPAEEVASSKSAESYLFQAISQDSEKGKNIVSVLHLYTFSYTETLEKQTYTEPNLCVSQDLLSLSLSMLSTLHV